MKSIRYYSGYLFHVFCLFCVIAPFTKAPVEGRLVPTASLLVSEAKQVFCFGQIAQNTPLRVKLVRNRAQKFIVL